MDIRLNAVKGCQRKISFSDTSSLTIVNDAAYSDTENEKSSIEINSNDITPHQVDLLNEGSIDQRSQHCTQHQMTQHDQDRWNPAMTTTNQDTTLRKTKFYQHIRQLFQRTPQLNRRQIVEYVMRWRWVFIFFGLSLILAIVMWIWRKDLLRVLETISIAVRGMGASGKILVFCLIFTSAFPPMIGYGTFQSLSGFTFGFNIGFPISYFSALFGAIACFLISRRWLKSQVKKIMAKYPNLEAVVKAVEKKGFKLFVLIRLSPYPYNLLNVLFASTDIPLSHFALGTAISLIKIALHVYIGAHLTSFAKHVLGDGSDLTDSEKRAETIRETAVVIGSILATGVMIYVYFVAKRAVEEVRQESEETRAFLTSNTNITNDVCGLHSDDIEGRQADGRVATEQVEVSDEWIEWNDNDEEKLLAGQNYSGGLMVYSVA